MIFDYPTSVNIKGIDYLINPFFKSILKIKPLLSDLNLYKTRQILDIFYVNQVNFLNENFLLEFIKFYSMENRKQYNHFENNKPVFDLSLDWGIIVADFQREYHIDLTSENIHYWRFIDLLNGLTSESRLAEIIRIREIDITTIQGEEYKDQYRKLKHIYQLENIEMEIATLLKNEFDKVLESGNFEQYNQLKIKLGVENK